MRHGMVNRKLGRTSSHRNALFRNQLASLIEHERIVTTLPKAKELRPQIERLVTLARNDSVHNRRQAARIVATDTLVAKLFDTLGPRFSDRPGGYTRIMKLGSRRGDSAEMAILEFIGYEPKTDDTRTSGASKKAAAKKESKESKEAAPAATEEEAPKKKSSKKAAPKAKAAEDKPKRTRKKKTDEE